MDPSGFDLDLRPLPGAGDALLVVVKGPLDAKNVPGFKATLEKQVAQGVRGLVLDLEGVKYVNSTGLAYLINLSELIGERRGILCLAGVQPKVKIILDTMGVAGFFRICASVGDAVKDLGKGARPPKPAAPPAAPRPEVRARKAAVEREPVRMSPPSETPPPSPVGSPLRRFFRRLLGRR